MEPLTVVKELAAAVSIQAQVANRFWIALMTVALFALLPKAGPSETSTINLPLGIGAVESASLNPVLFAMLAIMIVAFAGAHAQQVRAQKLAQDHIDTLAKSNMGLDPRELFDMLRQPSVTRVAPLAQSIRGPFQFSRTARDCPAVLWWASVCWYVLLKLASIAVYFMLPGWALWTVGARLHDVHALSTALWFPAIIAGVALAQVTFTDLAYLVRVAKVISRRSVVGTPA